MPSVLQLLDAVLLSLYQEWIAIRALAKLDAAVCSRSHRPRFLDTIKSQLFHVDVKIPNTTDSISPSYSSMLVWLVTRRMKASNWIIVGDQMPSLLMDLAEHTGGFQLRRVALHNMKVEPTVVFCGISAQCPKIVRIEFVQCERWFTVSALRGEVQGSLQELFVDSSGIKNYSTSFARNYFPNLRVLHLIAHCDLETARSLLDASPNLHELRLNYVPYDCLASLCSGHQSLEVLMLENCTGLNAPRIRAVAENCTNIRHLSMHCGDRTTIAAIQAFPEHCKRLEVLTTTGYMMPGSDALRAMAENGRNLRCLALCRVAFGDDVSGLLAIAEHCRQLEELTLSTRSSVADTIVQLLSLLPCLKELSLVDCPHLADSVLAAIGTHHPNLIHLGLVGARGYTVAGSMALYRALQGLRSLGIERTNSIINSMVIELWKDRLPGLVVPEQLYTTRCRHVSPVWYSAAS